MQNRVLNKFPHLGMDQVDIYQCSMRLDDWKNSGNHLIKLITNNYYNHRDLKINCPNPAIVMNTNTILMLTLIIVGLKCETDLSTQNCPTDFNMTIANVTKGIGTSQIATFFYSTYMGATQKTKIENYIIESNTKQISKVATAQYIWPYIAIGVVFALAFAIVILCMVFQKSCPPCQSWRRDFSKRPYQLFEIRCVALFAVIFSFGILATSIAAFTIIPSSQTHLKYTKCGLYGTLDVALNGDSKNWGGFSHIKNQVGNISKLLNSTNSQINTFFDDNTNIKDAMNLMKADNIKLHTNNQDALVATPDPYASASDQYIDSWFIKTKLGPTTSSNLTMTKDIQIGLNNTQKLSDQATKIIQSAFIIVQSSTTITANTQSSQQALTMYQNQLNSFKANLQSFSNSYFDPIFNWGIYVVEVIIGFVLVASLSVIIGAISIHFLNIYDCRHFLHFGWVIYGLTYFGIVFTAYYLLAMGSMGYTFCSYYKDMLGNQTAYNRLGQVYAQNVLNKLDICVHGNGNVLSKFKIQNQMSTVSNLFINIGVFKNLNDPTHADYVDQSISTTKIANWLTTLQSYRVGITKDVDTSLFNDINAMVALSNLNQFSLRTAANAGDVIQRCSRDRWVFDVVDCTAAQYTYVTPATEAQGEVIDMSYDSCISFNTKLATSSPAIWTLVDMQKRYKQIRQTCQDAYDKIVAYGSSLTKYRDSRINLFQGLIDQLTNLQSTHYSFNATLNAFRSNLTAFSTTQTIVDLSNFVTNKIDGLLVSSNCSPIGERMVFVYNAFCVNTMGSIVQLGICMMVLLALLIGGMFTACVFAQRAATVKRLGQIEEKKIQIDDNSIHSETFARKQKSQSSSQSSSDED